MANTLQVRTIPLPAGQSVQAQNAARPASHPWHEEAIRERDPSFDLLACNDTADDAGACDQQVTLSEGDALVWQGMVERRPALVCLRGI